MPCLSCKNFTRHEKYRGRALSNDTLYDSILARFAIDRNCESILAVAKRDEATLKSNPVFHSTPAFPRQLCTTEITGLLQTKDETGKGAIGELRREACL